MTTIRRVALPPDLETLLEVIGGAAAFTGVEAHLVGGFVRDRLLGRPLGKDIDLVTTQDGLPLLDEAARRLGWPAPVVFERFGTAQIRGDGFIVEVVRARSERYDPESRKPDVRPGTLEEDIRRRDFTVNALAQTLRGEVLDLTGRGLDDLRAGILRTPLEPSETFSEDPLRMFRGARFVAQLGFRLARGVIEAMREEAERARILSAERVRDEITRLLTSTHPREGLDVLRDSGLLAVWAPELLPMVGVEQGGWHRYDVWDHTTHTVELVQPRLVNRLAALFHDCGKPATHALADDGRHTFYDHPQVGAGIAEELLERLRFSNEEIEDVARLVRLHLRPIQYERETHSDSAVRRLIRDAGDLRAPLLDLARADTRASNYPHVESIDELERRMADLDRGAHVSRLKPPLGGHDLMKRTGRRPGPWIGRVHKALEEAILEGEIPAAQPDAAWRWLDGHPDLLTGE